VSSLNKICLIGNLGKDPELKHTQGGKPFCNFSIATSEKWTDANGETQERTEWHNISVWTKSAEACAKHLAKGSRVYVEGKLQSREYEKDGVKHRAWNVNAFTVIFLSTPGAKPATKSAYDNPFDEEPAGPAAPVSSGAPGADDDIPF
jgi:single-strand DNA-binding protein